MNLLSHSLMWLCCFKLHLTTPSQTLELLQSIGVCEWHVKVKLHLHNFNAITYLNLQRLRFWQAAFFTIKSKTPHCDSYWLRQVLQIRTINLRGQSKKAWKKTNKQKAQSRKVHHCSQNIRNLSFKVGRESTKFKSISSDIMLQYLRPNKKIIL